MRIYCLDHQKEEGEIILFLMFAAFESMKEFLDSVRLNLYLDTRRVVH